MEFITQLAAMLGTLGLLWFGLTALRRLRIGQGMGKPLQLRQRISIANGCQLVVVEWHGEELLIATGSHTCTLVAQHRVADSIARPETSASWAR